MATVHVTKMEAIKGLINEWLHDQTVYCNHCGLDANPALLIHESCCENPQLGRNIEVYMACCKQNKRITQDNIKLTGATKANNMRHAISIPPRLYSFLTGYFEKYGEKLFNNQKELHAFMKSFPQFKVCEQI